MEGQEATALGVEYSGIDDLILSAVHVNFDKGEDETDYAVAWELMDSLSAELIYADMNDDGNSGRFMLNYAF